MGVKRNNEEVKKKMDTFDRIRTLHLSGICGFAICNN